VVAASRDSNPQDKGGVRNRAPLWIRVRLEVNLLLPNNSF